MFTGNKTAAICCFFINNVKEFIYSLLELFFFQIIGTLVNMKVSISGMSEGFDNKTTFFSGLIYKCKVFCNLINRYNYVTLVKKLCFFHDSL